jgi:HD superfamily phosphodiesterase
MNKLELRYADGAGFSEGYLSTLKEKIERAMVEYLGGDERRIAHARRVTAYAEELNLTEKGDYDVIIAAGLLHDIGIHEAERKYYSNAGKYQEIEGPPIAGTILKQVGMPGEQIEEICQIIAHHHTPGKIDTINFKILYDADWLVNLGDEFDTGDKAKLAGLIEKVFLTQSGKNVARKIYLDASEP